MLSKVVFGGLSLLLPFVLITPSFAGGKGKTQIVGLEAELDPVGVAIGTDAEGESDYRRQIQKGAVKQERFELTAKVPIPSPALGITDDTTAANADVRVFLSHDGTPATIYAICYLAFTEIDNDGGTDTEAVYKVDVRNQPGKKGASRLHEVHGSCDINPSTATVDNGVPVVAANDVATVAVVAPVTLVQTDFLEGVYQTD